MKEEDIIKKFFETREEYNFTYTLRNKEWSLTRIMTCDYCPYLQLIRDGFYNCSKKDMPIWSARIMQSWCPLKNGEGLDEIDEKVKKILKGEVKND